MRDERDGLGYAGVAQRTSHRAALSTRDEMAAGVDLEPVARVGREDTAGNLVLFEHQHALAGARKQRRGDAATDAAAHDDRVVARPSATTSQP